MKTKEEEEYDVNKEVNIQRPSIFPTCPPTTATEGSASQSVGRDDPSPPWSPRTVHALCIRFTSPIKLSMVAIPPWKIASTPPPWTRKMWTGPAGEDRTFCGRGEEDPLWMIRENRKNGYMRGDHGRRRLDLCGPQLSSKMGLRLRLGHSWATNGLAH